ncbi:hypothetical protein [Anaerovibrio sp.]|uniref:hypothetical protein n=1 Tax=Anaerovibrio sp. TaxID=1872532 RepID=UPI0025B9C409|nr:hypothetical protein [Anaerovibrio sp.]MBR2142441.1 hypothetical protein [Anaerovibrio sp.]
MVKRLLSVLCILAITSFGGYSLAEASWTVTSSASSKGQVPVYMKKIPAGIPQSVGSHMMPIGRAADGDRIWDSYGIDLFYNSVRFDNATGRVRACLFINDNNHERFDEMMDYIMWVTINPKTKQFNIERVYGAKPHSNGLWEAKWSRVTKFPKKITIADKIPPYSTGGGNGWEEAVAKIMDCLEQIKTKRYADLRDFDDNVIQASNGYVY